MRWITAIMVCSCLAIGSGLREAEAEAQVRYVVPDDAVPGEAFVWRGSPINEGRPLVQALNDVILDSNRSRDGVELRLLARSGQSETLYRSVGGGPLIWVREWSGRERGRLVIRGQVDGSGAEARAITVLAGPSLKASLCGAAFDRCPPWPANAKASVASKARRVDNLGWIALAAREDTAVGPLTIGDQTKRINCARVDGSSDVEFVELGVRDCWLPAVAIFGSHHVALRDAVVQGSSYVVAAFPAAGPPDPTTAHSFEVTGTRWKPSPASYRAAVPGCDQRRDWDCPVSIWSDLP